MAPEGELDDIGEGKRVKARIIREKKKTNIKTSGRVCVGVCECEGKRRGKEDSK